MHIAYRGTLRLVRVSRLAGLLLLCVLSGCVAISNPVANGVPVRRAAPELLTPTKEDKVELPLSLLRQKPPDAYKLAPGDVLGVWIEGVLGERNQVPPVHYPESGTLPPALGFPIPVRDDGTLSLPFVDPIPVEGLTAEEAQEKVRRTYTVDKPILVAGRDRTHVTLLRRRVHRVLVIREEAGGASPALGLGSSNRSVTFNFSTAGGYGSSGRSQGFAIDLPAYENDVLNALALTGGLPGFESLNEILIERGSFAGDVDREKLMHRLETAGPGCPPPGARGFAGMGGQITRIPLRLPPGQPPPFGPRDILLQTGDIVYIQAREADLFYTGGLLPPGEFPLPRDYDLDVLEAVVRIGGPLVSSLNANNIQGSVTGAGVGSPSPSLLTVIRRTPGGGQVHIRVDLNRALRDPRERINIQAGDLLILQETPSEALVRYFNQGFFNFSLISRVISGDKTNGTISINTP